MPPRDMRGPPVYIRPVEMKRLQEIVLGAKFDFKKAQAQFVLRLTCRRNERVKAARSQLIMKRTPDNFWHRLDRDQSCGNVEEIEFLPCSVLEKSLSLSSIRTKSTNDLAFILCMT